MYSSLIKTLFALLALVAVTSAFAPVFTPAKTIDSSVNLFGGKKKKPAKSGEMDKNVFGGRGARITIREDEDNAMWIEEPKDKGGKKGGKKGK